MTRPLPFTENAIARVIEGARKAGLKPTAIAVGPDGTITVYEGLDAPKPSKENPPALSKWADAFGTQP